MSRKSLMGGDLLEEKTSCGSKGSRERRLAGRKNLLWVKKSSWEETCQKKKPPVGQKAHVGGDLLEEKTSCGSKSLRGRRLARRKNLLRVKKLTWEETCQEKEPPDV